MQDSLPDSSLTSSRLVTGTHCRLSLGTEDWTNVAQVRRRSQVAHRAALAASADSLAAQRSRLQLALVGKPQAANTDDEAFGLVQEAGQAADEAEAELEGQALQQWRSFMKASRSMQVLATAGRPSRVEVLVASEQVLPASKAPRGHFMQLLSVGQGSGARPQVLALAGADCESWTHTHPAAAAGGRHNMGSKQYGCLELITSSPAEVSPTRAEPEPEPQRSGCAQVGEDLWWDLEKGEMERKRGVTRNPLAVAKEKFVQQAAALAN